jgi:hypothetical protein
LANRAVLRSPGRAARGLVEWAIDLWPQVNGKAIVNKVDLLEMDSADMVDVIHYFFDEDMRYGSYESALMHSGFRERIYESLYEKKYMYAIKDRASSDMSEIEGGVKPYVPPTEFNPESSNPFGSTLDAPLG